LKVATELAGKEYKWENGAREWEIERTKTWMVSQKFTYQWDVNRSPSSQTRTHPEVSSKTGPEIRETHPWDRFQL
jgi:hypothetical protein